MAEVSDDAMFLISISYQALQRIEYTGRAIQLTDRTIPCDELVTVVFLGFYLEASLTEIIKKMGRTADISNFFSTPKNKPKEIPLGLRKKLAWFYNEYMEGSKASNGHDLFRASNEIDVKLEEMFPGFTKINDFRNDIAHGNLEKAIERIKAEYRDTEDVVLLRNQAKEIVDTLIKFAREAGHTDLNKNISYDDALNN
jgi:hypothetical protein